MPPRSIIVERDAIYIVPASQTAALLDAERDLTIDRRAVVIGYPDDARAEEIDDIIRAAALLGAKPETEDPEP